MKMQCSLSCSTRWAFQTLSTEVQLPGDEHETQILAPSPEVLHRRHSPLPQREMTAGSTWAGTAVSSRRQPAWSHGPRTASVFFLLKRTGRLTLALGFVIALLKKAVHERLLIYPRHLLVVLLQDTTGCCREKKRKKKSKKLFWIVTITQFSWCHTMTT